MDWGDIGQIALAGLSPHMYAAYNKIKDRDQQQAAMPILEQSNRLGNMMATDPGLQTSEALGDFASRPGFWLGNESEPQQGYSGNILRSVTSPDMTNPYIAKAVNDFGQTASRGKQFGDILDKPTPYNIGMGIASNPEHFASSFKQAASMLPGETAPTLEELKYKDSQGQTAKDKDFIGALDYITAAQSPEEGYSRMSTLARETDASPAAVQHASGILEKQFVKPDKPGKPQLKTNLYLDKTPEGQPIPKGYVIDALLGEDGVPVKTVGVPHKPTAVTSAELRLAGIPAYAPISGAFDPETGAPILLNRKSGTVAAAGNPQKINVGDAKADQKNVENLVKITGVLRSNEIEANKNFDQLSGLYKKLGNNTVPALNVALNHIKEGLGAPEPGTAAGVAYEAMTQYARVVNKQTTGGAITDTARKEINGLLQVLKTNPKQFEQKVKQYRITMRNAMESQDEAIKLARRGAKPSDRDNKPKTVVKKFVSPSTGKTKLVYSDGSEEIK